MDTGADPDDAMPQLEFIFLGGNLALDLVNTRRSRRVPGSWRIIQFDQLWNREQLADWWTAACGEYGLESQHYYWSDDDARLLTAFRAELRSLFDSIIEGRQQPPDPPLLNTILARGRLSVSLLGDRPRRIYAPRDGSADPLLAIALAASQILAESDLSRLRGCRSERCTSLFYDTSRGGTRQWCRPECMNRSRARANYRRIGRGEAGGTRGNGP